MNSKIIWSGSINPNELIVKYDENPIALSGLDSKKIEDRWKVKIEYESKNGKKIFNGVIYRLLEIKKNTNQLTVTLQKSDFKTITGLDHIGMKNQGLSVGGFLLTTDNYFVFGKLSVKRSSGESYTIIGGYVDNKQEQSSLGIYNNLLAEINEEIGVKCESVQSIKYKSIFDNGNNQYTLLADVRLSISKRQVYESYKMQNDGELSDVVFVKKKDLKKFLNKHIYHIGYIFDDILKYFL